MRKTGFIYLLLLLWQSCFSQDRKEELLRVIKAINSNRDYSAVVQYKLYVDNNTSKPFQETVTEIKRKGDCVYMKRSKDLELISLPNYQISVNKNTKLIAAKKSTSAKNAAGSYLNTDLLMDSAFKYFEKVLLVVENKETAKYELIFKPNAVIEKTTITVNKHNEMVERVSYSYKKAVKVHEIDKNYHKVTFEILYKDYRKTQPNECKLFDQSNYFEVVKGTLKPGPMYSSYQIKQLK